MGAFLWLIGAAFGQDPAPEVSEEIVVWGRLAIDRAKDAVVAKFDELGFREKRMPDGSIVFRHTGSLARRATLRPDGTLVFGRPVAGLSEPPTETQARQFDVSAPPAAQGGATVYLLPSERKVDAVQDEIREATEDELAALQTVLRRTALEERMLALPDALDRLWADGTPLDPGPTLATHEDRRRYVLARWASRTDTEEGRRVQQVLVGWLGAVVQASDAPITDAERMEFEALAGRPLP